MKDIVNNIDIAKLIQMDEVFYSIYKQYGSPPNWTRPQGFVSLAKIILEQQVSLASAKAHFTKLDGYLPSFTPDHVLKLTDEEMRGCQISRQKSTYLRALSHAILSNEINLARLSEFKEEEIRRQLTAIKGIGVWTSDIYLMFCLQSKDIFPSGDIAISNTVKELKEVKSKDELDLLALEWKPLRSLAAYFLWHHYLSKRKRNSN